MSDETGDLARFDPKATYDTAASEYVQASARFWGWLSARTRERTSLVEGARVLDVPCGPGSSAIGAAARVGPAGRIVALDSSELMLAIARRRAESDGLHNLDYRVGDMTRLEFPDESFDAVVSVLGIFFVEEMPALVADLWRLVRPGGTLAITVLGGDVFEPAFSMWKQVVADEAPGVLLSFPWQRTGDPGVLVRVMQDAGVTGCDVQVEPRRVVLRSADDWWLAVMGSGMRRAVIELGDTADRVRERTAARLRDGGVDSIDVSGIFGLATKGWR